MVLWRLNYSKYGKPFSLPYLLSQACANHMKKVESAVTERACQLLVGSQTSRTSAEPFRILSIGCGDGTFDAQILSAMMSRHPDVKIHYTGLDIDKETCQKATETLSLLKTNNKVDIKMLTMEFEDIDSVKAEISPCDLVLAVHVLYYMKDIKKALTDVQMLTKTNGKFKSCMQTHNQRSMAVNILFKVDLP